MAVIVAPAPEFDGVAAAKSGLTPFSAPAAGHGIWAASAWARARVAPGPFTRSQLTRERRETTVTRIGVSRWQPQLAPRTK